MFFDSIVASSVGARPEDRIEGMDCRLNGMEESDISDESLLRAVSERMISSFFESVGTVSSS